MTIVLDVTGVQDLPDEHSDKHSVFRPKAYIKVHIGASISMGSLHLLSQATQRPVRLRDSLYVFNIGLDVKLVFLAVHEATVGYLAQRIGNKSGLRHDADVRPPLHLPSGH